MVDEPVSVCVLALGDPEGDDRTIESALALDCPVAVSFVKPLAAPASRPGVEVRIHEATDDPIARWTALWDAVETPWVLLLVGGEVLEPVVAAPFAAIAASSGSSFRLVEQSSPAVVPDPLAFAGPRLVHRGSPLRWMLDGPLVADAEVGVVPLVLDRRQAAVRPDTPAADWLRTVVNARIVARGDAPADPAAVVLEAAALAWAGEHDAAVIRALELVEQAGLADSRVLAARVLLGAALAGTRPTEAVAGGDAWLAAACAQPGRAGEVDARRWTALAATLAGALDHARRVIETPGHGPATSDPWLGRATAGHVTGQLDRAAIEVDWMLDLGAQPELLGSSGVERVLGRWAILGREPAELMDRWPSESRSLLVEHLISGRITDAQAWLGLVAAYAERHGFTPDLGRRVVLMSPAMLLEDAVEWEARLRKAGMASASPLTYRARSTQLSPFDRVLSAAIAVEAFGNASVDEPLTAAAAEVSISQLRSLLLVADSLAPKALPGIVQHAATTSGRALHLADLLDEFGAAEQAEVLRVAALTLPPDR